MNDKLNIARLLLVFDYFLCYWCSFYTLVQEAIPGRRVSTLIFSFRNLRVYNRDKSSQRLFVEGYARSAWQELLFFIVLLRLDLQHKTSSEIEIS